MNRVLLSINWIMAFIAIYLFVFIIFSFKFLKNTQDLTKKLKENSGKPNEVANLASEYIRKNPLSPFNSSLRLIWLFSLIILQKTDDVRRCVEKIRAIDIYPDSINDFTVVIFLLKELGYQQEYMCLKEKSERAYKPCQSGLCKIIMQPDVDVSNFPNVLKEDVNDSIKAIVAYYRGLDFIKNSNNQEADQQFQMAVRLFPIMQDILIRKGYVK